MNRSDRSSSVEPGHGIAPASRAAANEPHRGVSVDLDELAAFAKREKLHRVIVVAPPNDQQATYLEKLFTTAGRAIPAALADWEDAIDHWCDRYRTRFSDGSLLEINLTTAIYIWDQTHERVVLAYGLSNPPGEPRDSNRIRQFPNVNVGIVNSMGDDAFAADRGHFLSHAAGGELDINLFPHRSELNQGHSTEGKQFRRMERHTADHPGTFHYHHAIYDDETWIPTVLEYGVLRDDLDWWTATFHNK